MVHKRGKQAVIKTKILRDALMAVSVVFNPICISTTAGYYNYDKSKKNIIRKCNRRLFYIITAIDNNIEKRVVT